MTVAAVTAAAVLFSTSPSAYQDTSELIGEAPSDDMRWRAALVGHADFSLHAGAPGLPLGEGDGTGSVHAKAGDENRAIITASAGLVDPTENIVTGSLVGGAPGLSGTPDDASATGQLKAGAAEAPLFVVNRNGKGDLRMSRQPSAKMLDLDPNGVGLIRRKRLLMDPPVLDNPEMSYFGETKKIRRAHHAGLHGPDARIRTHRRLSTLLDHAPTNMWFPAMTPRRYAQELNCLAEAIYFEARGEPYDGQIAVAQVVVNRRAHLVLPRQHLRRRLPEQALAQSLPVLLCL
jgi:hypothetical protein